MTDNPFPRSPVILETPTEVHVIEDISEEEWDLIQRHRQQKVEQEIRRAEHQDRADDIAKFLNGTVWLGKDGVPISVAKMTPRHARNALRYATKDVYRWREESALAGNTFAFAVPDDWPLIQALVERGLQEPTIVDRVKDRRDSRRFKKQHAAKR